MLKESTYSVKMDYKSASYAEVLYSCGTGKGNIGAITNISLAYEDAMSQQIINRTLSQICEIALYGAEAKKAIDIRRKQTFLQNVRTNLQIYSPTAPEELLPALGDIYSYLSESTDDVLVKAAMAHYQFEMLHPFEIGNGIMGRILIAMILKEILGDASSLICLSEFWYYNKNEYFDLLGSTQYSGGYERWIKHFVRAVSDVAKHSAELYNQYETIIDRDKELIRPFIASTKSVSLVYDHLKRFPIVNIATMKKGIDLSFNSIAKALNILQGVQIIQQEECGGRNRIWKYAVMEHLLTAHPLSKE